MTDKNNYNDSNDQLKSNSSPESPTAQRQYHTDGRQPPELPKESTSSTPLKEPDLFGSNPFNPDPLMSTEAQQRQALQQLSVSRS